MTSQETNEAIKNISVYDLISPYVRLKRSGSNYVGLCPFHNEKTPSFTVSPKRNSFKCFGCGKGGDAATFIMEYRGVEFPAALEILGIKENTQPHHRHTPPPPPKKLPPKAIDSLPPELLLKSLAGYQKNCFVQFLKTLFNPELVEELIKIFKIGTSDSLWKGATVFWQVDTELKARQLKVILYNPITGKRRKWKMPEDEKILSQSKQGWILKNKPDAVIHGAALLRRKGNKDPHLAQCFFGEHQLPDNPQRPVAIVESEKTAILMTGFARMGLPLAQDFLWLATGGKNGARWTEPEGCKVLEGRKVFLFPDLNAYQDWKDKSYLLTGCDVMVSDFLELNAPPSEINKGLDIADYFLKFHKTAAPKPHTDTKTKTLPVATPETKTVEEAPAATMPEGFKIETFTTIYGEKVTNEINEHGYPASWDKTEPEPVPIPNLLTKQERTLAAMVGQNPLVPKLIERFDLEVIAN